MTTWKMSLVADLGARGCNKMKCTRCLSKIKTKEPLAAIYVHASDGKKLSFILCSSCFVKFSRFMMEEALAAKSTEKKEQEIPPA